MTDFHPSTSETPADPPQRAWPCSWEQDPRIDDGHAHRWEMVVVQPYPGQTEAVTRCSVCTAPRCGGSFDPDPCMERRHHSDMHIYESGRWSPLGHILADEAS